MPVSEQVASALFNDSCPSNGSVKETWPHDPEKKIIWICIWKLPRSCHALSQWIERMDLEPQLKLLHWFSNFIQKYCWQWFNSEDYENKQTGLPEASRQGKNLKYSITAAIDKWQMANDKLTDANSERPDVKPGSMTNNSKTSGS